MRKVINVLYYIVYILFVGTIGGLIGGFIGKHIAPLLFPLLYWLKENIVYFVAAITLMFFALLVIRIRLNK